jgi:pilus assembly protein Flp/PilA
MLTKLIRNLVRDRKGGTAIEYGLIAALIVITMISAFVEVANTTTTMWGNVNTKMQNARDGN